MTSSHNFVISVEGFTQSRKPQGRRRRTMSMKITKSMKTTSKADDDITDDEQQFRNWAAVQVKKKWIVM